jgi:hypothetical protein
MRPRRRSLGPLRQGFLTTLPVVFSFDPEFVK